MVLRKIGSRTLIVLHRPPKYREVRSPGISLWTLWTNFIQEPLNCNSKLQSMQNSHLNLPWNTLCFFPLAPFQIHPLRIDGQTREPLVFVPSNWIDPLEKRLVQIKWSFQVEGQILIEEHLQSSWKMGFLTGSIISWFSNLLGAFFHTPPPGPPSLIAVIWPSSLPSYTHSQLCQAGPISLRL